MKICLRLLLIGCCKRCRGGFRAHIYTSYCYWESHINIDIQCVCTCIMGVINDMIPIKTLTYSRISKQAHGRQLLLFCCWYRQWFVVRLHLRGDNWRHRLPASRTMSMHLVQQLSSGGSLINWSQIQVLWRWEETAKLLSPGPKPCLSVGAAAFAVELRASSLVAAIPMSRASIRLQWEDGQTECCCGWWKSLHYWWWGRHIGCHRWLWKPRDQAFLRRDWRFRKNYWRRSRGLYKYCKARLWRSWPSVVKIFPREMENRVSRKCLFLYRINDFDECRRNAVTFICKERRKALHHHSFWWRMVQWRRMEVDVIRFIYWLREWWIDHDMWGWWWQIGNWWYDPIAGKLLWFLMICWGLPSSKTIAEVIICSPTALCRG